MTAPQHVPIAPADRVRPGERMPHSGAWRADRAAELRNPVQPTGDRFGKPGPNIGFGLKLARHFEDRLVLAPGEHAEDAIAGCFAVGTRRAGMFGRAPVIYDMELAFRLWGYLSGAPADLVAYRFPLFQSAAHDYWDQRAIVDLVPEATLRLTPAQVEERLAAWRSLLVT